MEKKSIRGKLLDIQMELKAPKGQFNSYGGYKYRSCEDIIEAAKPLSAKAGTVLTLSDTIVNVGDRFYVKAEATLIDTETGDSVSCTAFARESATKKGMDESQITGTASSYARKYALNGLFCIDDTKDADTDEFAKRQMQPDKKQPASIGDYKCGDCGKPFTQFTAKSGKVWTPADVYKFAKSKNADGVARCEDCMKKRGS